VPTRDRPAVLERAAVKQELRHPRKDDRIATPRLRDHGRRRVAWALGRGVSVGRQRSAGTRRPPRCIGGELPRGAGAPGRARRVAAGGGRDTCSSRPTTRTQTAPRWRCAPARRPGAGARARASAATLPAPPQRRRALRPGSRVSALTPACWGSPRTARVRTRPTLVTRLLEAIGRRRSGPASEGIGRDQPLNQCGCF
jgi:hypothetical protein